MKKLIVIQARFQAIHAWPDCPIKEVSFLRNKHRHEFHVVAKWPVDHNNRELEFFMMKNKLQQLLLESYNNKDLGSSSCEQIAEEIARNLSACFVSVFEDGENGAEYYE